MESRKCKCGEKFAFFLLTYGLGFPLNCYKFRGFDYSEGATLARRAVFGVKQ